MSNPIRVVQDPGEIDVPNIVELAHLAAKLRSTDQIASAMDGGRTTVQPLTYYSSLACDLIEACALEVHARADVEEF